ncbi:DUF4344 domain-containing metallopeptidase [Caenispirillum bisanense]|uniref:DUF4344 domain-containing metallopeptidase n=1 Tax=Caenispirillum bisanense TaxID=414052 RepID=UPI0031E135FF
MGVLVRVAALLGLAVILAVPGAAAQARGFSAEERQEIDDFVAGNVLFTLYHEIGHALVSEFELPVLGREEDAVDSLAALMMISDEPDEQADAWIIAAADWFWMAYDQYGGELTDDHFAGEHSLDPQRYYALICLIYGSDPEGFAELAETAGLPEDRAANCPYELEQVARSWVKLLEPHEGKAKAPIRVSYGRTREYADAAAVLKESKVLEYIAEEMRQSFAFPNPILISAAECGVENAFWDPQERTVTLCYELVEGARQLIINDILAR